MLLDPLFLGRGELAHLLDRPVEALVGLVPEGLDGVLLPGIGLPVEDLDARSRFDQRVPAVGRGETLRPTLAQPGGKRLGDDHSTRLAEQRGSVGRRLVQTAPGAQRRRHVAQTARAAHGARIETRRAHRE